MSKSLPANPNLENLKKQAKILRKTILEGHMTARIVRLMKTHPQWFESGKAITLRQAQHMIAGEYGFENWQKLCVVVEFKRKLHTRLSKKFGPSIPPAENGAKPRNLFSDAIKRTMENARREAERLKHAFIGTEHLLLGMISLDEGSGVDVLKFLNADLNDLKRRLEDRAGRSETTLSGHETPFTTRSKHMLERVVEEARAPAPESGSMTIGTGHLLLALTRDSESEAAQVLNAMGIDYARIRTTIETQVADQPIL